jgi:hypothetical protein
MDSIKAWSRGLAAAALVGAGAAAAGSATNTLTNIVTVADACDIVAVGVDFGITTAPISAAGVVAVTPNTTVGNTATANTSHPDAAADGGAGNDDQLGITTPVSALNALISPLLSAVSTTGPGVYVACTTSPSAISVQSAAAGAVPFALPVSVGGTPSGTYAGKMEGVGGGAAGANTVDYTLTFTGTPTSTAVGGGFAINLFIGAFTATGTIPGTQSGTVVPGYYSDVATAQVDF